MDKIVVIVTGGTFSKVYDPDKGELIIRPDMKAMIEEINRITYLDKNINFDIYSMIGKDSLYIDDTDRDNLVYFIDKFDKNTKIVVIHGTDTINNTAKYLHENMKYNKTVVLTGSMMPYSIDPIEAVSNYTQAVKDVLSLDTGVYISIHGVVGSYRNVFKDRSKTKYDNYYFTTNK